MRVLLAVCFVVALGGSARAQVHHYPVQGFGTASCAKYAELYRREPDEADKIFLGWALGYMSGVNIWSMAAGQGSRDLGAKDSDEMTSFLRHYCDAHPLATYLAGVLELMDSLPLIPYQKSR